MGGLSLPKHYSATEIRLLPREGPVYPMHFVMRMKKSPRRCPLCDEPIFYGCSLSEHCRRKGDDNHLALEVMDT